MALLEIRTPIHKREIRSKAGKQTEVRWQVQIVRREDGKPDQIVSESTETDCNAPPEAIAQFESAADTASAENERRALVAERDAIRRAEKAEGIADDLTKENDALKEQLAAVVASANEVVGQRDATIAVLRQKIAAGDEDRA